VKARIALATVSALAAGIVAASAQSFDCAKATHADEKAVCSHAGLSALDDEMAGLYDDIMQRALMGVRGEERDNQRAFLAERQDCGADVACIHRLYEARIKDLEAVKKSVGQGAAG
jgi:uncharacterized protein